MAKQTHEHAYVPTQSKLVRTEEGPTTVVLLHCKCGDFSHSRLPGEWSWAEIVQAKTSKRKSDVTFLREMGIRATR